MPIDTEQEIALRNYNHLIEERLNMKGGIPQSHKFQPDNSIKAFKEINVTHRHKEILNLLHRVTKPMTDREIKTVLDYEDMNSIRPRVSELIDFGYLFIAGNTTCPVTGKRVRQVRVRERQEEF